MSKEQELLDSEVTYRVIDMSLVEVKRIGATRWQKHQKNRLEWAMFPLCMIWFLVALVLRLPTLVILAGFVPPMAYGYWSTWDQMKKRNKAATLFVEGPSVRKNGDSGK